MKVFKMIRDFYVNTWKQEGAIAFVFYSFFTILIVAMLLVSIGMPIDKLFLPIDKETTVVEKKESVFHPAKSGSHMVGGKFATAHSSAARTDYYLTFQIKEKEIKTLVTYELFSSVKEFNKIDVKYRSGRITGNIFVDSVSRSR